MYTGLTHTTTEQFPCVIIAMYHFLRKCSEGWTYNIHDMSRKYPKEEIVVNLYKAALTLQHNRTLQGISKSKQPSVFSPH